MSNILITIPEGLGDSIQCLPSIDKLIQYFPNHNINLICADFLVEMYKLYLPNLNIFFYQEIEVYQKIEYEWFIDLSSSDWSSELKEHIQYSHIAYHKFYTCKKTQDFRSKIIIDNKEYHTALFNMSDKADDNPYDKPAWALEAEVIAKIIGLDINKWIAEGISPEFVVKDTLVKESTILVLPGGVGNKRKWPNENFRELIKQLIDKDKDIDIVLGPAEIEISPFYKAISGLNVFDNLSLVQLSEKILASKYIITQDCGLMHLACSFGKPVLAIFGPTNENCWFTYNGENQKVIRKGEMIKSGFIRDVNWADWPTVAEVIKEIPKQYL